MEMSTIELKRSVTTPVKIINYLYFAIGFLLIERFLFKGDGDTAYFVSLLIVSVILLIAYKWPAKPYIIFLVSWCWCSVKFITGFPWILSWDQMR